MPREKKEEKRGRQTPTQALILPYTETKGAEAAELYGKTGREPQEWQTLLLYDILATNEDGLWTHVKFGYSLPRRNGKNEVVAMRELWGLQNGEEILHTAHRTTTSHAAWERLCSLLDKAGIAYDSIRATGRERIVLKNTSGRVEFRTRSTKGGLGEGFDLLIIDEAQEYTEDQESALKYTVSDSPNPQTLLCGTPPTPNSSGTVFVKLRSAALSGESIDTGWAEWSTPTQRDPQDRTVWYETNPSLGTILTERKIVAEIGPDVIDFNIQRLGLWLRYNQKSAISRTEWSGLQCDTLPELTGKLFVGVKFGQNGKNVALSIATYTQDDRIFVETVDCRPIRDGVDWILSFLSRASVEETVVDGASGQQLLKNAMKEGRIRPAATLPTVKQVVAAHSVFEQALFAGKICHMGQPSLAQCVSNCEHRAIGSSGGFGYRSLREDIEIALLESVVLAVWARTETKKERKKQQIIY